MPSVRQSRYRSLSARRAAAITSLKRPPRPGVNNGQKYVAIADHINSYSTFKEYTKDKTKYNTLAEAYAAYKEQVEDNAKYTQYKDTLPE